MITNFVDVMQKYKTVQELYQAKLKERMIKQAMIGYF